MGDASTNATPGAFLIGLGASDANDDTDVDDPKTVEHRSDEPINSPREKASKG